jgi:hypothetical protein
MDIRETLLAEHSKRQMMRVVEYVGTDTQRFRELMGLFLGDTYRVSQRAAWPVSYCIEACPALVKPYFGKLIEQLERDDAHPAIRRNVVRLLQFVDIPKRYQGRIFDACYNLFADPMQPVAVRVFSMTVAAGLAKPYPEMFEELRVVAAQHPEAATAGFRSRVRRVFGV